MKEGKWVAPALPRERYVRTFEELDPLPLAPRPLDLRRAWQDSTVQLERSFGMAQDTQIEVAELFRNEMPILDYVLDPQEAALWAARAQNRRTEMPGDWSSWPVPTRAHAVMGFWYAIVLPTMPFAVRLLDPREFAKKFLPELTAYVNSHANVEETLHSCCIQFRLGVLPYLERTDRELVRDELAAMAVPVAGTTIVNLFAAMAGAGDVARKSLAASTKEQAPLLPWLVMAQPTLAEVVAAKNLHDWKFPTPNEGRDWQILTGAAHPEPILRSALATKRAGVADAYFALLTAPDTREGILETLPAVLTMYARSKRHAVPAAKWFKKRGAIIGDALRAYTGDGELSKAARAALEIAADAEMAPEPAPRTKKPAAKPAPPKLDIPEVLLPPGVEWTYDPPLSPANAAARQHSSYVPSAPAHGFTLDYIRQSSTQSGGGDSVGYPAWWYAYRSEFCPPESRNAGIRLATLGAGRKVPVERIPLELNTAPLTDDEVARFIVDAQRAMDSVEVAAAAVGFGRALRCYLRVGHPLHTMISVHKVQDGIASMDDAEKAATRGLIEEMLEPFRGRESDWWDLTEARTTGVDRHALYRHRGMVLVAAGLLGMDDLLTRLWTAAPDGYVPSYTVTLPDEFQYVADWMPQCIPFREVIRVTGGRFEMRGWTKLAARYGREAYSVIPQVRASFSNDRVEDFYRMIALRCTPETIGAAFDDLTDSKGRSHAIAWLDARKPQLYAVLIRSVLTGDSRARAAEGYLRLEATSHPEVLRTAAAAYGTVASARVEEMFFSSRSGLGNDALIEKVEEALGAKRKAMPDWLVLSELPALHGSDGELPQDAARLLLAALAAGTVDAPHEALMLFRSSLAPASLDLFARTLLEQWEKAGGPSKDRWAMESVATVGGDAAAQRLAAFVLRWPAEKQLRRAQAGLEVLRSARSDGALAQLSMIVNTTKKESIRETARGFLKTAAQSRGLSPAQLADRIAPSAGLPESGTVTFDYGTRVFTLVLDDSLQTKIRMPDGTLKADLPAPNSKDDAAKAGTAQAQWKVLKKNVANTAKAQAKRLELLIAGGRWTPEEFGKWIVAHPLVGILARRILWCLWLPGAEAPQAFRVAEDGTCADAEDRTLPLPPDAKIGIAHPLHFDAAALGGWRRIFFDYMIVTPLPQFDRAVLHATEEELAGTEIARLKGRPFAGKELFWALEGSGWVNAGRLSHGRMMLFTRDRPALGLRECMWLNPGFFSPTSPEPQGILRVSYTPQDLQPGSLGVHEERVLRTVDPVALSELLANLEDIARKVP